MSRLAASMLHGLVLIVWVVGIAWLMCLAWLCGDPSAWRLWMRSAMTEDDERPAAHNAGETCCGRPIKPKES